MTVVLNHTIVPVGDKHRSSRFLADLLDLAVDPPAGPFVPVRVNDDLTLDFDDRLGARPAHYAFLVDDATFDRALRRVEGSEVEWGSAPRQIDYRINRLGGGRGVYVLDPDGIAYELFTRPPLFSGDIGRAIRGHMSPEIDDTGTTDRRRSAPG